MRRIMRKHESLSPQWLLRVDGALAQAERAATLAELRGLEGSAARAYFALFRQSLPAEMTFTKRSWRPPRDAVNALLGLGYTLLNNALMTALEVVGLDPLCRFLSCR